MFAFSNLLHCPDLSSIALPERYTLARSLWQCDQSGCYGVHTFEPSGSFQRPAGVLTVAMRVVWQGVSFPANRTHGVTFHRPAGVLTVAMRVVWQEVSFPANRTHGVTFHRPNGILTVGGVSWQAYVSFAPNRTHA